MTEKPPAHLKPATALWFTSVVEDYELDQHHVRLLTLAAEAWDRGQGARELVAMEGICYADRFGAPRIHPAVAVERDAVLAFARLVRELRLSDDEPPDAPRLPRQGQR